MKPEENERLVRVGPGTPGGNFLRRYWLPALLSSELPEPDGPQVRVRLLSEDLIAFRDTKGQVGLVGAFCPHRRAPLFFGVNGDCGIRCAYHGWKFNRDGHCIDMPSEPAGTPLQSRVHLTAYPTFEAGGIVWTYMGDRTAMPEPPNFEWLRVPETHRYVSKTYQSCNYLQGLEGGLDTAHVSFLHADDGNAVTRLAQLDTAPKLEVNVTDYGYNYVSHRRIGAGKRYIRIYQYIMPVQQMRPSVVDSTGTQQPTPTIDGHIWAPVDDEHTNVYNIMYSYDPKIPLSEQFIRETEEFFGRGENDVIPGTFCLVRNASNNYLIDRKLQKQGNMSGIVGVNTQDYALQEAMGPIVDRSKEFLGSTDRAIVTMRRLMLEGINAIEEAPQSRPRGSDPESHAKARAHDDIVGDETTLDELMTQAVARW